ncbi:hypothetical protein BDV97DRAFT_392240 [Delphinella strobiligena]|nr:hypothetical protein BDV97DRAFT_392240 [Delphinella strobiligena]
MDTQSHCAGPTASKLSPHAAHSSAPEEPVSKELLSKAQKSQCQVPPNQSHEDCSDKEAVNLNSEATSLDTKEPELLHHHKETQHRRDGHPATNFEVSKTITPHLLSLGLNEDIKISQFDAGGFNQLFNVTFNDPSTQQLLFRIAIGEKREDKVNSEVATMEYVRRKTTIPVPKVYAYDSSCNNPIGSPFEYVQAERYAQQKSKMSRAQQETFMKQVAEWSHQLRRLHFDKIGSLYLDEDGQFSIGPLISDTQFQAWQNDTTISHGPFSTVQAYYKNQWEYEQRPSLAQETTLHDNDAKPPQHIPDILSALTQPTPANRQSGLPSCTPASRGYIHQQRPDLRHPHRSRPNRLGARAHHARLRKSSLDPIDC